MRYLVILLATVLFAGNLINVNFFPHKRFIDVLLSLDGKFNGRITKIDSNTYFISNVISTKVYEKSFESEYVKKVVIAPYENGIKFVIVPKKRLKVSIALTPEGYGIRFRLLFSSARKIEQKEPLIQTNQQLSRLDYTAYILVLAILAVAGGLFFVLRKKIKTGSLPAMKIEARVMFQKPIDAKNKVVLFEFNKRKYLMVVGTTNILLDIFDDEMVRIQSQQEFDEFLKLNSKVDEIKRYIQNAEELKEIDEKI
ncbi:MAG: hypothetical protein GXO62_02805 [Epsilonproteobacteria bacterium]|nr:hypothetical protein [Campylobacterota bacterium]